MDHEDKERLKRVLELAEKDHNMVRKLYSAMRWGRVLKIIYWVAILGIAVGAFYFLQPFFESLVEVYKSLGSSVEGLRESFGGVQEQVDRFQS